MTLGSLAVFECDAPYELVGMQRTETVYECRVDWAATDMYS